MEEYVGFFKQKNLTYRALLRHVAERKLAPQKKLYGRHPVVPAAAVRFHGSAAPPLAGLCARASALPWLPTEPEKVGAFEALGIERQLLPLRVYRGAARNTRRHSIAQAAGFQWPLKTAHEWKEFAEARREARLPSGRPPSEGTPPPTGSPPPERPGFDAVREPRAH